MYIARARMIRDITRTAHKKNARALPIGNDAGVAIAHIHKVGRLSTLTLDDGCDVVPRNTIIATTAYMQVDTALVDNTDICATMTIVGTGENSAIVGYRNGGNTVRNIRVVEKREEVETTCSLILHESHLRRSIAIRKHQLSLARQTLLILRNLKTEHRGNNPHIANPLGIALRLNIETLNTLIEREVDEVARSIALNSKHRLLKSNSGGRLTTLRLLRLAPHARSEQCDTT